MNRIGQQLGNYRLIRLLGAGGFAEVYLGEHIHLGTQAAIKILYTQLGQTDIEQFRNEARTIAHLEHPHIVRILDFGIEGSTPFLVMSYAPNGTLRTRHPKGSFLPLVTVVSYVNQVASALQYAHDHKLIHRDIKPENLLVGRSNDILLSDFGIALITQSSRYQSTRDMAGTIAYMAPEQINAHPHPASDQYSLGIVVYEWLSGERPFHGSFAEIAIKHTVVPPPSLLERVPTLSPTVEQVVMTALAKDPKQRFDSIQTFADTLRDAAQLSPSMVTLTPTIEARMVAPTIPIEPVSQPLSAPKPEALVPILTDMESTHLKPAIQTADVPPSLQHSTETLHSSPQDPPRRATLPPPQKRRSGKRSSWLVGGALGLISLLVVLIIILKPILFMGGGPSAITTTRPHTSSPTPNVPSATPTYPDQVTQKWTFPTHAFVFSSPTVVNGMLYVGSEDINVYAIDANTGTQKWAFPTSSAIFSSPAVINGAVYVGSYDHKVYAIDANTGTQKWAFTTSAEVHSSPTVVNGVLYIGSFDDNVYAIDASSGTQKWAFTTGAFVYSSPTVVNGVVYVGSDDNKVYAIDANTGTQKWAFTTGSNVNSSPTMVNGVVYVGSDDNKVYAIDANTGTQKWAFTTGSTMFSSPLVVNGVVYVGSDDNKAYAIDANTGTQKWAFTTGGNVNSSPTIVNGVLYIGSDDHKVYAIDANTGLQKWAFTTGDTVKSSPTVVNGVLYVGSDTKVYALTLPAS